MRTLALALAAFAACAPAAVRADVLPSRPITFWNDRVIVSGDASITYGSEDDGYFNLIDYYHDSLNVLRLGLSLELKANDRLSVLGQVIDQVALRDAGAVRSPWEPFDTNRHVVQPYALFVRAKPWASRPITVQAGRIPPVFGAFARQDYGAGQPLIGLPLAYHYPTTLRPDSVPENADGLVDRAGEGWRVRYYYGGREGWATGVPLVASMRWDTGAQVQVGDATGPVDVSVAVTNGTLSSPRVRDDNGGKQVSARVAVRPATGLVAGVSGSRGTFLSDDIVDALPPTVPRESFTQSAVGVDLEYSRGYWLVRSETIVSSWRLPAIEAPLIDRPLRAFATFVEGRLKLTPRWYAAARWDHLGFSEVDASAAAGGPQSWDAPVTRVEVGGGYSVTRNVRAKVTYQYNWRDAGTRRRGGVATQLVYWF